MFYVGFFLAIFPFVSPYPINADVQPLFFIISSIACLCHKKFLSSLSYIDAYFAILITLAIFWQYSFESISFKDILRFLFAFFAFKFWELYSGRINQKIILYASSLHLLIVFIHFMLPQQFLVVAENLVRVIKVTSFGSRGASGLAPEPGFTGVIAICLIVLSFGVRKFNGDKSYLITIAILNICCLAISKSGAAGLLLVGFFALSYLRLDLTKLISASIFFAGLLIVIHFIDLGRTTQVFSNLISDPFELLKKDVSIGARALSVLVSIPSLFEYPFGAGIGSFEHVAPQLAEKYVLSDYAVGKAGGVVDILSMLSLYIVELGLFWLFFLLLITIRALRTVKTNYAFVFVTFFLLINSFSIAFPLTWLFVNLGPRAR